MSKWEMKSERETDWWKCVKEHMRGEQSRWGDNYGVANETDESGNNLSVGCAHTNTRRAHTLHTDAHFLSHVLKPSHMSKTSSHSLSLTLDIQ